MTMAAPARVLSLYARSEEHTSELQSRFELVCRLLLEKKKQDDDYHHCVCCKRSDNAHAQILRGHYCQHQACMNRGIRAHSEHVPKYVAHVSKRVRDAV